MNVAKSEDLVKKGGFEHYTILRPTEFMSNYTGETAHFQVPDRKSSHLISSTYPSFHPHLAQNSSR